MNPVLNSPAATAWPTTRVGDIPQDIGERAARAWLALIVAASATLRIILCLRGGQFFWNDEVRFLRSWTLLERLLQFDAVGALDVVLRDPIHYLFTVVGLFPAAAQYAVVRLRGGPPAPDISSMMGSAWIAATALSAAGLACIVLVYAIARRSGSDHYEALLAAFLMAGTTTLTASSRYLLPYDSSMALALLALWQGMKRSGGVNSSLLCGFIAAAAFGTYNGYWLIAAVAVAAHVAWAGWAPRTMLRRALAAGPAFVYPLVVLEGLTRVRQVWSFADGLRAFSGTVTQGAFAEGWSLPWKYLWYSEHLLLVLWLVAATGVIAMVISRREARGRGIAWLAMAAAIYAGLVVTSVWLRKFVVYGRNAREMAPFFSLAAALFLAGLLRRMHHRRALAITLCALITAQAAWNLRGPLAQNYPREVGRLAVRYQPLRHASSFGPAKPVMGDCEYLAADKEASSARYVLMNTCVDMPVTPGGPAPHGRVVFAYPHPMQYTPNQYEGLTPGERELFRLGDPSMRLIDTAADQEARAPAPAAPPSNR